MKLLSKPKNRLLIAVKQSRLFFNNRFSMHIIPLIFALVFTVMAENRLNRQPVISENTTAVADYKKADINSARASVKTGTGVMGYALASLGATHADQLTTIYKTGYFISKIIGSRP